MAKQTQSRGRSTTSGPSRAVAARLRATGANSRTSLRFVLGLELRSRVFLGLIVVSALLHLPLLPTSLFSWLSILFGEKPTMGEYDDAEAIIPIELDLAPPGMQEEALSEPGDPGDPSGGFAPPSAGPADAGVDAAPEPPDAGPDDAGPQDAGVDASEEIADAGPGDGGTPDAGPREKIAQPIDLAGPQNLSEHPNVQVLISGKRIRKHKLGPAAGELLQMIPEWKSFFGGTGIDPVRDIDHLLITGPQFRNSSEVVAVLDFNVEISRVRGAIDHIVKQTNGEWLEGAPVPTAKAHADKAERLFAIVPQKELLVVLPLSKEKELGKLKRMSGFNDRSQAGIVVSLVTPWRAFGKAFNVPKSIAWMRLTVIPDEDGGATLHVDALDASPEEAMEHAKMLSDTLDPPIIGPAEFYAQDNYIRAEKKVTSEQLESALAGIRLWLTALSLKKLF